MRFVRDLWINFLANILTAAVLYLLARATGYIGGNAAITAGAITVLSAAAIVTTAGLAYRTSRALAAAIVVVLAILLGVLLAAVFGSSTAGNKGVLIGFMTVIAIGWALTMWGMFSGAGRKAPSHILLATLFTCYCVVALVVFAINFS
jgi:hypothetical protein